MRILLDQITAAGTHFPIELSKNSRHFVSLVAEGNGGTPAVTPVTEGNEFVQFTQFVEQPDDSRTVFTVKGYVDASKHNEIVIESNGSVLTSGYTWTAGSNKVTFSTAPAAGTIFRVAVARSAGWVEILTVPFTAAGNAGFDFNESFKAMRVRVSSLTTAKFTASISSSNR